MKKLKTVSIGHPFHIEMLRTLSAMAAIWAKASGWGVSPTLSESQAADKCKQPWRILVWRQNTTSPYLTKLWSKRFCIFIILLSYLVHLVSTCMWPQLPLAYHVLQIEQWVKIKVFNPLAGCILMRHLHCCPGAPPLATSLVAFSEQTKARLTGHIRNAWKLVETIHNYTS